MALAQSPYRRLQKRCMDAGISAKGSAKVLEERLLAAPTFEKLKKTAGEGTSKRQQPHHRHRSCCGLGRYMNDAPEYGEEYVSSGPEEWLNIITHGALALAACCVLLNIITHGALAACCVLPGFPFVFLSECAAPG